MEEVGELLDVLEKALQEDDILMESFVHPLLECFSVCSKEPLKSKLSWCARGRRSPWIQACCRSGAKG